MFRISILGFRISRFCPPSSETSVNQKRAIMQNKPNFHKNRMNVNYYKSKGYENTPPVFGPKIPKPISPGVQMSLSLCITTNYEPRTMNYPGKNKPNSKPIQTQFLARSVFIRGAKMLVLTGQLGYMVNVSNYQVNHGDRK